MAMLRVTQRRFAEARKEVDAILDIAPEHLPSLNMIGALALFAGWPQQALEQYQQLDAQAPQHPTGLVGVAQAQSMLGDKPAVQRTLDRLRQRFASLYISPYQLALIELRRGNLDATFGRLEQGTATRDPNIVFALTDPALDDLRSDSRFAQFLERHRLGAT